MGRVNRYDLPALERARAEFTAAARALADGGIPLIEGTRRVCRLGHALDLDARDDADFRTLVAFDSETDALPAGPERANWAPAALAEKDREAAAVETHWGEPVRAASARLVARFVPAI